jgi:predicted branched-subunit amino acid permease
VQVQDVQSQSSVRRDAAGIGLAVGVYGVAFGAAAVAAGLSVAQASVLSLAAFTGASQFAAIGVLGAGGGLLAALGSALLLGARNTLYGLRLAPLLRVRGPRRLLAAHAVIDETTAMALGRPQPPLARAAFWSTFASIYLVWNAATLVGAIGARALGDPARLGLDAAAPAAFLALLAPRLRSSGLERRVAVAGVLVAVALTPLLPPGVPVLLAATSALLGLRRPT